LDPSSTARRPSSGWSCASPSGTLSMRHSPTLATISRYAVLVSQICKLQRESVERRSTICGT
jgi:hypothetical protein